MKILITGSLGTIGQKLVKELQLRSHFVFGCDLAHNAGEFTDYMRCDVGEFRQLERAIESFKPGLVYHAAAEFGRRNGEDYYEMLWRTNAVGTKNIIRLQERMRFKLVHFSSSEVYGDTAGIMEEKTATGQTLLNDYAMTKWVNEQQIHNSEKLHGTETVIVRLFNTYGPGEYYSPYRSVNCRFLYTALKGEPLIVHAGHRRTSTFVDDTVNTLSNIADAFRAGRTYNVAGGSCHTIEELAEIAVEVCGGSEDLIRVIEPEPLTTIQKLPDTTLAQAELGHTCAVTLRDGMARTAKWMQSVYR